MHILIGEAMQHFYMLWESLILCKHGNILLFLAYNKNTILNLLHIEIPTNKGADSYILKISKIVNLKSIQRELYNNMK